MKQKLTHLELHSDIKAPMEEVYKIISDFENMPKYFPKVAKSFHYIIRNGNYFEAEAETKAFLGSQTFKVHMKGTFFPNTGFTSTNVSSLGVEHEIFRMEEISEGTLVNYTNDVEINNPFFRIFGNILIKRVALWYWKREVLDKIKLILEK